MIYIEADSLQEAYKKTFIELLNEKDDSSDPEIYKENVATIEIAINNNDNFRIEGKKFILKEDYSRSFPYIGRELIDKELIYWETSLLKKNNLSKVIAYLKKDPLSKRAIILFWEDKYRNVNGKSVCEIASFFRTKCEYLDMHTMMRANNASFLLYMDMDILTSVHKVVADSLGLKTGRYIHFINSLHFYNNELDNIKQQDKLLQNNYG